MQQIMLSQLAPPFKGQITLWARIVLLKLMTRPADLGGLCQVHGEALITVNFLPVPTKLSGASKRMVTYVALVGIRQPMNSPMPRQRRSVRIRLVANVAVKPLILYQEGISVD